ncbi:hypothetical protein PG999_010479 [Apiospora kogelbergensis]|uniref:DUF5666 domain-containing protein n=1 Tax=Apiospora kogelbergensis TaxID=1337665 RepID=A0AAW0QA79_9PEZI
MKYATALFGLLAATGAFALPAEDVANPNTVTITLRGQRNDVSKTQVDKNGSRTPNGKGRWTSVELASHNIKNDKGQDLRCKIFSEKGKEITVTRGQNVDTTFSDAGKGKWTFKIPRQSQVGKIQCSTKFNAAPGPKEARAESSEEAEVDEVEDVAEESQVEERAEPQVDALAVGPLTVTLRGPSELATQTQLKHKDAKAPTGSRGPYNSVQLKVVSGKKEARCQLIGQNGKAITLVRGKNIDTTFGDGGKGAWAFKDPKTSNVKQIKCDPSFKSRN